MDMSTPRSRQRPSKYPDLLLSLQTPSLLLHPLAIFSIVWIGVVLLYSMHLSKLLLYSTQEVVKVVLIIWIPFAFVILACTLFRYALVRLCPSFRKLPVVDFEQLENRLTVWFQIWIVISITEIIVSGGIPLLWLIQQSSK